MFREFRVVAFVTDVPFAIIVDQAVSPFFSHGSGPFGFEASIERGLRGHLGVKASVSRYADPFRGTASFCQLGSCAVSLTFEDDARAVYFVAGRGLRRSHRGDRLLRLRQGQWRKDAWRAALCHRVLECGEPQIDGVCLALRQREGRRALAPCLEQVRVPFLARLQVSHGNRHITPGR
jgi:hypothetical protein